MNDNNSEKNSLGEIHPESTNSLHGSNVDSTNTDNVGASYNNNWGTSYSGNTSSNYNNWGTPYSGNTNSNFANNSNSTFSSNSNSSGASPYNNGSNPKPMGSKKKREKSYISKSAFVFGIILSIIISSTASVGGMFLLNNIDFDTPAEVTQETEIPNNENFSIAEATGSSLSVQEIVEQTRETVVEIRTTISVDSMFSSNQIVEGAGSGVIIKEDGYIVTNNHVIDGASEIIVKLTSGIEYPATVVGTDALTDLALLKIEETGLPIASFGDSTQLELGDLAVAIGNPLGQLGGTSTVGTISALDRQVDVEGTQMTLIQTDAAINEGNSGGGLFDGEGNLIGIVVAKAGGDGIEGLGFAIPSAQVLNITNELYEHGEVTNRPIIGVSVVDIHSSEAATSYGVTKLGVYVREVTTANAINAGIEVGDIILAIDDTVIDSSSMLIAEVQSHVVGDTVTLTIDRDGDEIEISVELSAM